VEKFLSKLENIWYHYKWAIIAALFALIIIIIVITQVLHQEKTDIRIAYCGPAVISADQNNEICGVLTSLMSKDFDGDGNKNLRLTAFAFLTDDQLAGKQQEAADDGDFILYDPTSRSEVRTQLTSLIASGEVIICLLDDYMYSELLGQNAFATLEGVLGYKPEKAADDYSICVGDTDFWQYFTAMHSIPENTRLCIVNMSVTAMIGNRETAEREYGWHKQMLSDMLSFKSPEAG